MRNHKAKYGVGQLVHHRLFDYRGVIIDVDASFQNTDEWYKVMARSRPAKNQPWYHVLVDNTDYTTYVAEQNLEEDKMGMPISHPEINEYFNNIKNGIYSSKKLQN